MSERTVPVRYEAKISSFVTSVNQMRSTVRQFADETEKKTRKAGTDWEKMGSRSQVAGLALGAGLAYAAHRFADFDQAMSAASAALPGAGAQMDDLRQLAIKLGADTQFSATEAAQGITEMGKAGVSATDILGGGLKGALSLAAAGQLEVGQAAEIAATAINQFGLRGNQVSHVADLYAAAAGKAQGSVADIALAQKYAGVTAASMGVSIEQTTATLGLFASKGIVGEQAGTTFRGMLLSLTSPSKIAKQTMDDLGISMYDARGKFVGIEGAAAELQKRLSPLDEATRNQALGQIFGNEQMNGAIALYQGGASAIQSWTKEVNDAGYAQRQAAKLTDNWKGDIERLGGSLDSVFVKNGSKANGALRGLTQNAEHAVDTFGQLPDGMQTTAVAAAALTTGGLLLGGTFLAAVPKIQAAKVAIVELGIASEERAARGMTIAGKAARGLALATTALTVAGQAGGDPSKSLAAWGDQQLANDLTSNADALAVLNRRFAESAKLSNIDLGVSSVPDALKSALDPSGLEKFDAAFSGTLSMFGFDNLSNMNVAHQRLGEIDTVLTQLVNSGNGKRASEVFSQLAIAGSKAGLGVDDIKKALPQYSEALASAEQQTTATQKTTELLARSSGHAAVAFGSAEGAGGAMASTVLLLGKNAETAKDAVDALSKKIQGDMDAASTAFSRDLDVLGKYDPQKAADDAKSAADKVTAAEKSAQDTRERIAAKKKKTISDTQAIERADAAVSKARAAQAEANAKVGASGLEAMYKSSIATARKFTNDISTVTRKGLDPQVVAKLLQEGPTQAGPALEALVGKNSANLIKMVNTSEAQIRRFNGVVVEQARLTSAAVNAPTGVGEQMVQDLDVAMGIAQVKASQGGKATAEQLAKALHSKKSEIERVAAEFGIALQFPKPKPVRITVAGAKAALAEIHDVRQELANLDGARAHTVIETRIADERDRRQDAANAGPVLHIVPPDDPRKKIHRASGGEIVGGGTSKSDSVPLMGSNGEWVIQKPAVDFYGKAFFAAANAMQLHPAALPAAAGGAASYRYEDSYNFWGDIHGPDLDSIRQKAEDHRRLQRLGRRRAGR